MPSSTWFDVVLWCDGASFVLVPLSAVQPPSAHFVLFSVQCLSEVAPGWFVSPAMKLLSAHRVFFSERCVAEAVPCCIENALKFQVSELGLGRYEDELKNPVSEIVPGWPEAALLAAVVRAATLFVFTPVCFQSFEGSDGGLGPRFLKCARLSVPRKGEMKAKLKRTSLLPLFIGCFPFRCALAGMGLQPCPQLRSSASS